MDITKRQMEIVQAAIKVIAEQGYEKLTTKNLANCLGVSDAAMYKHFDSKRELIHMILNYFQHISNRSIEHINAQDLSPLDSISSFVLSRYELFTADPDLAMVIFSEELFKNDHSFVGNLLTVMHIHRDEVMRYIVQGQEIGQIRTELNPLHLFRIIVGSMRLTVTQWNLSKHAFSLLDEGKSQLQTIIKLIEVAK